MAEEVPRTMNNQTGKRLSSDLEDRAERIKIRKGILKTPDSSLWICRNPACKERRPTVPSFCKRCTCCICHQFDKNVDSSLWLKCTPESSAEVSCGFSCHVECAFLHGKVGICALQLQLDGCYSCATCGKASSIIGCWKKQLKIAMDSKCADILCHRIFLCYRLLNGTAKYRELHKFVEDMKVALEMELGPINQAAAKMSGAHVGRLHAVRHVQALCKLAIQKAEELLSSSTGPVLNRNEGSVPSSATQGKSRADGKSDSRLKGIPKSPRMTLGREKEAQESCSGAETEKCIGVGDAQPETLQLERLPLPDLNEEFIEPDTKTVAAPVIKSEESGGSDVDFETIVKTIRGLEHDGHVSKEFRLKFLTWFSLKARRHECRVVRTFIKTMMDDPSSLAGQLADTFSLIIFGTRP